jgi:prephenate dehydrogenase
MVRTIGIIGYGSFGAFLALLARRFLPEASVRIYSLRRAPDGEQFFSFETVAACDIVLLAVPIHAFEETLSRVVPHLGPVSIVIDVATVKVHTAAIMRRLLPGRPYVATHPMFGPESYAKRAQSVAGLRIVVAEQTLLPEAYEAARTFLVGLGFDVVHMEPERHDKHLAETLFLTHFIGQIVARAGFDRTAIDTVSFGYLMDAVESVKHDAALFLDVFRFNPYCKEILDRFEISEKEVRALLERGV